MAIRLNSQLQEGQALGHYQLIQLLDRRRAVEIWRGQHISLPIQVALKILVRNGSPTEEYQRVERRLRNEALMLEGIRHQHIVVFRDYLLGRDFQALVIEYAPYGSASYHHGTGRKLPLGLVRLYTQQIGQALSALHQRGIIHRDVKPGNILLAHPRHALLADFGLAMYEYVPVSLRGGTPSYMAPEQYYGSPGVASDQYSLATSVYEWLTGQRPFSGTTERMMRHRERFFPASVRTFRPELSEAIDAILRRALDPDPVRRYPDVLDFARAFVETTRTSRPPLVRRLLYYRGSHFHDVMAQEDEPASTHFHLRETGEQQALHLPAWLEGPPVAIG